MKCYLRLLNYEHINQGELDGPDAPSEHQSEHVGEHPGDHHKFIDSEHDNEIDSLIVAAQDGAIDIGLTAKNLGSVVAIDDYIDSAIDNVQENAPQGDHPSEHVGDHKKRKK